MRRIFRGYVFEKTPRALQSRTIFLGAFLDDVVARGSKPSGSRFVKKPKPRFSDDEGFMLKNALAVGEPALFFTQYSVFSTRYRVSSKNGGGNERVFDFAAVCAGIADNGPTHGSGDAP